MIYFQGCLIKLFSIWYWLIQQCFKQCCYTHYALFNSDYELLYRFLLGDNFQVTLPRTISYFFFRSLMLGFGLSGSLLGSTGTPQMKSKMSFESFFVPLLVVVTTSFSVLWKKKNHNFNFYKKKKFFIC